MIDSMIELLIEDEVQ